MRTKKLIIKTYLELLNIENKLGYTEQDIINKLESPEEFELLNQMFDQELYATEKYRGQDISTNRAFRLWCSCVHHVDVRSGRTIWNSFLPVLFDMIEKNRLTCFMACRGGGKCVKENSMIKMGDGSLKKIKHVVVGDKVLTLNEETMKQEIKPVRGVMYTGKKQGFLVKTRSGREIIVSKDHPLLIPKKQNGGRWVPKITWEKVENLNSGDVIGMAHKSNSKIIPDIFWDEITSINKVGSVNMYDLEIAGDSTHNFIANDFYVHNSFFWIMYVSFKQYLLDYYEVCYAANVPKQKKRFLRLYRMYINGNELLLEKKDVKGINCRDVAWGSEELEYNKGTIEGTTLGTTPKGGHYNLVIIDDILREDKKYTDEYVMEYIQGSLKPTIYTLKGRMGISGTPQHSFDPLHTLMNEKLDKHNRPEGSVVTKKVSAAGFYSDIFPGILNMKTKEVLVSDIWTFEELMLEKSRIGEIRWWREIQCKCTSYKNSLIGVPLFRTMCNEKLSLLQKGEEDKKYMIVVDSATSDAPTADFCAMSVFELPDDNSDTIIFRYLFHEKGCPVTDPEGGTNDQIHKGVELHNLFNQAFFVIEKNNAGVSLSQALQAKGIEVIEHYTHSTSTGKVSQKSEDVINYIEHGVKKGNMVIPSNSDDNITMEILEKVKNEHTNYGVKKGKSGELYEALAGKDDIFDTFWMAWKYRSDGGGTIPFAVTVHGGG